MAYRCEVIADSVSPAGMRLTSLAICFPKFVLAELNTHRMLSRSSASSRAIPVEKMIEAVERDPVIPVEWGKNTKGMQSKELLDPDARLDAESAWLAARTGAVAYARSLLAIGAHKQIVNRVIEPWVWSTTIVTATEWENFFALRCHPDAQPEIRHIAEMMRDAMAASKPARLRAGQWHLPYVTEQDRLEALGDSLPYLSAARCARVSYLTHEGKRDLAADEALAKKLISSGHMSPLEHPAMATGDEERHANFVGWRQLRKLIPGEAVFGSAKGVL